MASIFLPMLICKCCIMLFFCLCYFPEHDVTISYICCNCFGRLQKECNDLFDLLSRKLFDLSSFDEAA